jgi:hypothetical protein
VFFKHYLSAHDVDGFVKMIKQLSENKEMYQQSLDHPRWLKNYYRKEAILKQWEDFYQEVVNQYGKTH